MRYVTMEDFRTLTSRDDFDHLVDLAIRDKTRGVINHTEFQEMCKLGRIRLAELESKTE